MSDPVFPGPHECVKDIAFNKRRVASESDNIASLIDCRRRVPPLSTKVPEINHVAVFPEHGVLGRMSPNCLIADAGNTHNLTIIIDRRGSS
jgi:hypothetical protein